MFHELLFFLLSIYFCIVFYSNINVFYFFSSDSLRANTYTRTELHLIFEKTHKTNAMVSIVLPTRIR